MKTIYGLFLAFLIIQFYPAVFAQTESAKLISYNKDGLKFEYPSDWTLTNKTTPELQLFYLSKPQRASLIVISTPTRFLETENQFTILQADSYSEYGDAMSKSLSFKNKKAEWKPNCVDFNGKKMIGVKYSGFYKNEPGTGEIYPFNLGNRFLTLVYFRPESEEPVSDIVWQNFIKSLSLEGSNRGIGGFFFESGSAETPIMNGKALKLVKPEYPATYKEGSVRVKVSIDEEGNVVSAEAITGDKVFHKLAAKAAKASKFSPTMGCNKIHKVIGIIIYNFVK